MSGIKAATGLPKTSRSTTSRIGAAISSARSIALSVCSWIAAAASTKPVMCDATGGRTTRFSVRRSAGTVCLLAGSNLRWMTATISARSGRGRSTETDAPDHGPKTETAGTFASARVTTGPWASIAEAGPWSMTETGLRGPNSRS